MFLVFAIFINSFPHDLTCETVPQADDISGLKIVCIESITTTFGCSLTIDFIISVMQVALASFKGDFSSCNLCALILT